MGDLSDDDDYLSDNEEIDDDYYQVGPISPMDERSPDPELFKYEMLDIHRVEGLLNECVESVCKQLQIIPSLAKQILHANKWHIADVITRYQENSEKFLVDSHIKSPPFGPEAIRSSSASSNNTCRVCLQTSLLLSTLVCGHSFCHQCWASHFTVQVNNGMATDITCMDFGCDVIVPEDFVMKHLPGPDAKERYQKYCFRDYVTAHPLLSFCPGVNCNLVAYAPEAPKARRVQCGECSTSFCFLCRLDYHVPAACDVVKKWLTKCADDSETANYIQVNTKDCPNCHICIEKNGGCNHMQCFKCHFDFCWVCLTDWKPHNNQYYECNKYKEDPKASEGHLSLAREALKKYLFYYERWNNHERSLKLEKELLEKINKRMEEKIQSRAGTWIDWQPLLRAGQLLTKCRYSLQYTYPCAYYMPAGPMKGMFEYRQAQLEREVENLSWRVENAELEDCADLEQQMSCVDLCRRNLIAECLSEVEEDSNGNKLIDHVNNNT